MNRQSIRSLCTGLGDSGFTSVYGGRQVYKSDRIIHLLGDIDEITSFIGIVKSKNIEYEFKTVLTDIQKILFVYGLNIQCNYKKDMFRIKQNDCDNIEFYIEKYIKSKDEIKDFILPGKSEVESLFIYLRSLVRRFERNFVDYMYDIKKQLLWDGVWINRASDLFYLMALKYNLDKEIKPQTFKLDDYVVYRQ